MKLQELLTKHKDKLWDWLYNQLVIDNGARENYKWIIIDWRVNDNPMSEFSLSDLLFSTPFLSLLEWKMENYLRCKLIVDDVVIDGQWQPHDRNTTRQFDSKTIHKINLVLLNTDEERISYLENNTI